MIAVAFHRLAAKEYRAAVAWYSAKETGLGKRFQRAVEEAVERIISDPLALPFEAKHFRWVRVKSFSYRIIFELADPNRALVIAVAHTSRRPGYWRRRA